jgi:hypothetical protein
MLKIQNNFTKNILSKIIPDTTKAVISTGTGQMDYVENNLIGSKSLRVISTSYKNTDLTFNFGNEFNTPIILDGIYFFSMFIQSDNDITLEVSLTGSRTGTVTFTTDIKANTKYFQRFANSIELIAEENFNVTFKLISKPTHNTNNINFLIDGLKLELNNGNGLPTDFSKPDNDFGYQSMIDTINSQNIPLNIDTKVTFNNNIVSAGGLDLIDVSSSVIKATNLLDVLLIDFSFTFPSPAGTNDFVKIFLKINNVIYKASEINILAQTGLTNYVSVIFNVPIDTNFINNYAELYINSSVSILVSNKNLFVQRTFKNQ